MPTIACNALNISEQGMVYFDGVSVFSGLDGGTSGQVLTSNGTGLSPSFQPASGGISSVNATTCGSSVAFIPSTGNALLQVTDSGFNTIVGQSSGGSTTIGTTNQSFGAFNMNDPAFTGTQNSVCGSFCMQVSGSASGNSIVGNASGQTLTTGANSNTILGSSVFATLTTGHSNVGVGNGSGGNYTSSESNNVLINNAGVLGDQGVTRIGNSNQTSCFVAGVYGVKPATSQMAIIDSVGQIGSQTLGNGFYGDGSDGSPTFDGINTILGLVPSTNVYTLNRDIFLSNPIINSGITIITENYKIYCNGTLTNNGTIEYNGNNGTTGGTGGAGLFNGGSIGGSGTAGGAGNTGAGGTGVNSARYYGSASGAGGAGGSAGGASGTATVPTGANGSVKCFPAALFGNVINATGMLTLGFGPSGGGGGGDGVTKGGGGGGGGGTVLLNVLFFSGTGIISSTGGSGGNGGVSGTNCGGGGGGSGGNILINTRSIVGGVVPNQTTVVTGGSGGSATGLGSSGGNGGNGYVQILPL